ncbi:MAG: hypothetical protein Q4D27_02005 [Coriobacteriia bacterium]|nr:hypothetical protein [Coriobacteriia bacterium]
MTKKLVITGVSAMQAWDEGARPYARPSRVRSPNSFAAASSELAEFSALPQGCVNPVEILVGSDSSYHRTHRWRAHVQRSPLPPNSILDIGLNRCMTSPEFFFLRTAPKLSLVQAVLLGMELCGWYSTLMSAPYRQHCDKVRTEQGGALLMNPWPPTAWDLSLEHQRDLMKNGFVVRPPLTDAASLREYLHRALSEKSNSRALVAARYVADNSRSPMESRIYARYCLPRRYGGFNLVPVELNREFELSPEVAQAIGIEKYSVDLYWPRGKLAIEYQGRYAHSGLNAEQRDRLKRNILETEGVRIISIDSSQYAKGDILDIYAGEIASSMGIEAWRMKPSAAEQRKRLELINELESWDVDLYRPTGKR